jgi:twitching motility protein PilT
VLVTGTAGSGKTTTLAAMIDHINHSRDGHIVTIEDPIEVLHQDDRCIINQREIGIDTDSYAEALRHVVRQDPDIILIGEMRDHETVSAALTAAEIGNLVLSTLHTIDATETINRIIDFFPPYQQKQIRLMLASTLRGIVSMRLIPSINGGLVPAVEVLVVTGTIREYIIDPAQTFKIKDAMEEGEYYGMQTFDQSLLHLYQRAAITMDDAMAMANNSHDFKIKVRQLGVTQQHAAETGIY